MSLHIPEDILIIKILLLLPFESILKWKLVSKQWRNLITNPKFYKLYNPRSSLSLFLCKDDLYCLLIKPNNNNLDTIEGPGHPPFMVHCVPIGLRAGLCPAIKTEEHKLLSGSSNGVACVRRTNGDFLIYNLFNGDSLTVADAPLRQDFSKGWLCYGFGYDSFDDDYKIMVVCLYNAEYNANIVQNEDKSLFWVYSVTNRVWKEQQGFPYAAYGWDKYFYFKGQACSLNGVLHWVVSVPGIPNKKVVVTYDLHTCRFGEILLPQSAYDFVLPYGRYDEPRIGELDGQLCCWRVHEFKFWVMKEYGVGESWTYFKSMSRKTLTGVPGISAFSHYFESFQVTPTAVYKCRSGTKGVSFVSNSSWSMFWFDLIIGGMKVICKPTWSRRGGNDQSRNQDFE